MTAPPVLARVEYFRKPNGARIAYASAGEGPPLAVVPPWVYDMEALSRGFGGTLWPIAEGRRLVLYDREGTGLSERRPYGGPFERHAEELLALLDHLGIERTALVGISQAGPVVIDFAARYPERVTRLLLVATYAVGPAVFTRPEVQTSMLSLVRAHWGIAAKALADMLLPNANAEVTEALAADQRRSAEPETAARALEEIYGADVGDRLAEVRAPALVVHHRDDRAIPFRGGVAIASGIAGARLVPIEGRGHAHINYGRHPEVLAAMREFLAADGEAAPGPPTLAGDVPLTARELEVLRLVSEGLSNAEIAERLTISTNTVANHLKNVLAKTGAPNRAAAATYALRAGLI